MKLSFECKQDIRKMPNRQGKKFCINCNKHVHDLRRKSYEQIALFYENNPGSCVIAYGHQLDKVNRLRQRQKTRSYFPYAAGILAVALLPTLAHAQSDTAKTKLIPGVVIPISIPDQVPPKITNQAQKAGDTNTYFLKGKVKLSDGKARFKGKQIIVYVQTYTPEGELSVFDTLVVGELNAKGKFQSKINSSQFYRIRETQLSDLSIRIEGMEDESFGSMMISGNTISILTYATKEGSHRMYSGVMVDF